VPRNGEFVAVGGEHKPASGHDGPITDHRTLLEEEGAIMPKLLAVDDEPNVLYSIQKWFRSDALEVAVAPTGRQALEMVERERPDAVVLDVCLGDMQGLDVLDRLRRIDPRLPVILITAYGSTDTAIEAMKRGAVEYLLKPVDFHQLREAVQQALELSRFRHVAPVFDDEAGAEDAERIVGRSPTMQEVYKAIGRSAPSDVTVLITGESGTGKELVARALYHHGRRVAGHFLVLNCASIPETLLESELFGHERGAFTGAERRRIGKFEQADGGTLFLDEIGDMSAATQAKVLRLLQEQRFERLGGNETIQADVRLIAATNKDLEAEVAEGRFRRDLFYRLKVFTIHLPRLRERREDIPLLTEHFLRRFGRRLGRAARSVAPEAQACLNAYLWPGNVRQLQGVLKYALIQSAGEVLTLGCLPEEVRAGGATGPARGWGRDGTAGLREMVEALLRAGETDIYRRVSREVDRVVLQAVLGHAGGNQVKASELLGISRTTLRAKLRDLNVAVEKQMVFGPPEGANSDPQGPPLGLEQPD
jgi:two-component system nitrogen regulation response regulator GlnG